MKKLLSLVLALVLACIVCVSAGAANEESRTTALTYTVASNYTVTIPESINLSSGTTGEYGVVAGSIIDAGKDLKFTITGSTNYDNTDGFRLENTSGTDVYLSYSIKNGENTVEKDIAFLTATAAQCYAGTSVTLIYEAEAAQSAGSYTDTVTIKVAEE